MYIEHNAWRLFFIFSNLMILSNIIEIVRSVESLASRVIASTDACSDAGNNFLVGHISPPEDAGGGTCVLPCLPRVLDCVVLSSPGDVDIAHSNIFPLPYILPSFGCKRVTVVAEFIVGIVRSSFHHLNLTLLLHEICHVALSFG